MEALEGKNHKLIMRRSQLSVNTLSQINSNTKDISLAQRKSMMG